MSTAFYVSYAALWLLVVIEGVLLLLVYRHFGMMTLGTIEGVQRDGIAVGEKAPQIYGVDPTGREIVWEPTTRRAALLVFASPDCEPCGAVLPVVERIARARRDPPINVMTIVPGQMDSAARTRDQYGLTVTCVADDGSGVFDKYRVRVTPFAFVIGEDGLVRSKGLCSDPLMLRDLLVAGGLDRVADSVSQPVAVGEGTPRSDISSGASV